MNTVREKFCEIDNYGMIGNLQTNALISLHGSIDFMCFPDFDSPMVFGAILDQQKGGCFSIHPEMKNIRYKQLYLTDTAILVTRFLSDTGAGELSDFMMIDESSEKMILVRKLSAIHGDINYRMNCQPHFDYARASHTISTNTEGVIHFVSEQQELFLTSSHPLTIENEKAVGDIYLREGQVAWFFLTDKIPTQEMISKPADYGRKSYEECFAWWKNWIASSTFTGRWIDPIFRSAIILKLLSSQRYGSFVAAPTFGLPEEIGGERNWDYRYTWIRDAAFTMYAFLKLGFIQEATGFLNWVEKYCIEGEMKLVYTIQGEVPPDELELELAGYKNSKPVRIGNAAHGQTQLDIYGELIDTIYIYDKYGAPISENFWKHLRKHVDFVTDHWREPDHGIWEIRGEKKEFLHSRLMCWVAVDRAIRIAERRGFSYDKKRWEESRAEIKDSIFSDFWNAEKKAFVQHKGSDTLDAAVLLMPIFLFIDAQDEKWVQTFEAIERELKIDVLIYRYRDIHEDVDGLDGEEGTFSMCSFWYAECLARMGRFQEASEHFAKILSYANPLRLFAEQIDKNGEQVGNYPQALTHLALINAGIELEKHWSRLQKGKTE